MTVAQKSRTTLIFQREIDGIPVEVRRKKIRNLYLRIDSETGKVSVTAPLKCPDSDIETLVHGHLDWIFQQQKRIRARIGRGISFRKDEQTALWGKSFALEPVYYTGKKPAGPIFFDGGVLRLPLPEGVTLKGKTERLNNWYRTRFQESLPDFTARMEARTGLKADTYRLRNMTSRWGTCNPQEKKILLNLKLVKYPPECLEYVLIHELTHLVIPHHGPDFWAAVEVHCPDWQKVRRRLNDL